MTDIETCPALASREITELREPVGKVFGVAGISVRPQLNERLFQSPQDAARYPVNVALRANGSDLLGALAPGSVRVAFFDPQYRGVMEKMRYGNEGSRQIGRAALTQMSDETIRDFIKGTDRALAPSGHLFLWVDKFHLCEGMKSWLTETQLMIVDLIVWDKDKIGMGYRSRRKSEYLVVLQKAPSRAKGVWSDHSIPDVWREKIIGKIHPHQKPEKLCETLIRAVSDENETVLDPAAGSFRILQAARSLNRVFIGCDIETGEVSAVE